MIGIYKIENKINGKVYIGKAKSIGRRWKEHMYSLEHGNHHSYKLQQAYNKYGIENLMFSVIETCKEEDLSDNELKYISKYDSLVNGYNVKTEGLLVENYTINSNASKYIVDIDSLCSDIKESALIVRYIYLYLKVVGINNKTNNKKHNIKKFSDLNNILKLGKRRFVELKKELIDMELVKMDSEYECGFVFTDKYIRKSYAVTRGDLDKLIIYKDAFIEMYESCDSKKHKPIGNIFKVSYIFNNECSSCTQKELLEVLNNTGIYKGMDINRLKDTLYDEKINNTILIKQIGKSILLNPNIMLYASSLLNMDDNMAIYNEVI